MCIIVNEMNGFLACCVFVLLPMFESIAQGFPAMLPPHCVIELRARNFLREPNFNFSAHLLICGT